MRLRIKVALQEEAHNLMVTEASTEVEGNMIFIVLGIHWERGAEKFIFNSRIICPVAF